MALVSLLTVLVAATALPVSSTSAGPAATPKPADHRTTAGASLPTLPGSPACAPSGCPAPTRSAPQPAAAPVLGSTATNWLVSNWSGEGMIAENPSNPENLVAGGLYQYPSSLNNTSTYYTSGVSGAFASFDGGRSWSGGVLPPSPDLTNASSPQCNHYHLADTAIVFGPNDTVYYVDLSYSGSDQSCSAPPAGTGLYVTVSTDGGKTWGVPVGVAGMNSGSSIDKPWAAIDPTTGEVYVAYTDDGNGSGIYLQHSTDRGQSWSAPVDLSAGVSGSERGVELVVDPYGGVDATWIDQGNAQIYFVRSVDGGSTFSSPRVLATALAEFTSPSPDGFRAYTLPGLGVDDFGGNPYTGRLLCVWQNGSGGSAGTPAVSLSYSSDNGSTWSRPVRVDSDHSFEDFQPDVAVGADGAVYVEWYGVDPTNGHYRLYATVSRDGGRTFDPQFAASDVDSYPNFGSLGNAWWIGDYTHVIGDRLGARPLWTDARSTKEWTCSPCLWGYVYNITFYTALLVNTSIVSSFPLSVTESGSAPPNGTLTVTGGVRYLDWMGGERYNLTAPANVSVGGETYYFSEWFGSNYSPNASIQGVVNGSGAFHPCYATVAGGACHAPGAPGWLEVRSDPSVAALTLAGRNVTVPSNGSAVTFRLDPGAYELRGSALGYYPYEALFNVTPGNVTYANATFAPIPGTLAGNVTPANAQLTVDGRAVLLNPDGSFSLLVLPGLHNVSASSYGWATYTNDSVTVVFNATTELAIALRPLPGWVNGTVDPTDAHVTVNRVDVPVVGGAFSIRDPVGTYWVNASALGYEFASSGPVQLGPLGTARVALHLVKFKGTILGQVEPPGALVSVNATSVPALGGGFRVAEYPGTYWVNVSAPGYVTNASTVNVQFNTTTFVNVVLTPSNGWVHGEVTPTNATVTLDGAPVVVSATGGFNASAVPGSHTVMASGPGYESFTSVVNVSAGAGVLVTIALSLVPSGTLAPATETALFGLLLVVAAVAVLVLLVRRRRRRDAEPAL